MKKIFNYRYGVCISAMLRVWKTEKLVKLLHRDRKKFDAGKGKPLASLRDL